MPRGARPDLSARQPASQAAVEIVGAVVVPWVAMWGFQGCRVVTTAWSWRRIAASIPCPALLLPSLRSCRSPDPPQSTAHTCSAFRGLLRGLRAQGVPSDYDSRTNGTQLPAPHHNSGKATTGQRQIRVADENRSPISRTFPTSRQPTH